MNDEMPERTYLKMHAWALQIGTLTDTAYIREDLVAAKDAEIERLKARNDLLEKVAEHAVSHMTDGCGWPFTASDAIRAGEPELAAYLKDGTE